MKNYRLIGIGIVLVLACSLLWGQEVQVRGVLVSDHVRDETALWVERQSEIVPGREIVLENAQNELREVYHVKKVVDTLVILEERLRLDYPAGSRLLQ